jgi:hypothetical protein
MADSPEKIREHIEVLTNFERLYSEFVQLLAEDRQSDFGPKNTAKLERVQREVLEAAPRVDTAAKASGHWLTTTNPPMMGSGIRSSNLAGQVMDIEDPGFTDDGLRIPRMILQTIPIQIGALKEMLSKAENRKPTRAERKAARRALQEPPVVETSEAAPQKSLAGQPVKKAAASMRPWHENPWVVGVGVTVIGGLILVGILGLIGLLG